MSTQDEQNTISASSTHPPIENESRIPPQVQKRKSREPNLTSKAWNHFKLIDVDGERYGECNYCEKLIKTTNSCGTKGMDRHIQKHCPKKPRYVGGSNDGEGSEYFDQEVSRKELAYAIILHEYPLSIVDHVGFRKFVSSLQPLFKMVSRNTIKNDIMKIFDNLKSNTSMVFEKLSSRIAITTDMWTSDNKKKGFMAITGHFIDDSWHLQSHILRFVYVPSPHDSAALANVLFNCLFEWNLERRISTITVDNAANNTSMMDKLLDKKLSRSDLLLNGRLFHVRCAAHILNLIVQEGLKVKEVEESVEKVRDSVMYWIASPGRIERFEVAARLVHCSCSKKLSYDCPTRWNSTYLMLNTAIEYKETFKKLKGDTGYRCCPSDDDWVKAEIVCSKLKLFNRITEQFSGTQYPTSSDYFNKVCEVKIELDDWGRSSTPLINKMASAMLLKFQKYWDDMHILMSVGTIFDPRYKMKLVEFFLPHIYGAEASTKIEEVRTHCRDLFEEYNSQFSTSHESFGTSNEVDLSGGDRLSSFDMFVASSRGNMETRSELDLYLEEDLIPRTPSYFDNLSWWKTQGLKYPTLQKMARDVLAIPVTTVASESAFSTSGRLVSPHRSRLNPNTLEALMCCRTWLWNELNGMTSTIDNIRCPTLLDEEEETHEIV